MSIIRKNASMLRILGLWFLLYIYLLFSSKNEHALSNNKEKTKPHVAEICAQYGPWIQRTIWDLRVKESWFITADGYSLHVEKLRAAEHVPTLGKSLVERKANATSQWAGSFESLHDGGLLKQMRRT